MTDGQTDRQKVTGLQTYRQTQTERQTQTNGQIDIPSATGRFNNKLKISYQNIRGQLNFQCTTPECFNWVQYEHELF